MMTSSPPLSLPSTSISPISVSNGLPMRPKSGANEIEPGLYLGDFITALNKEGLQSLGVKHILRIADDLGPPVYPEAFDYTIIEIADSVVTDISSYFDRCFQIIDQTRSDGGAVLVHCLAGISRSATVVIAYLMKRHGMGLSDALALVKSRRPAVRPNDKFLKQLREFEAQLLLPTSPRDV